MDIVAPSDFSSRGTGGDFKAGSDEENAVKDAWFVFFAENGNYVDAVEGKDLIWSDGTGTVEKISSAMLVLSNPQQWPTQVVALLNTGYSKSDFSTINSLARLQSIAADYRNSEAFVMSNSVYMDGETKMFATPLKDTQICDTKDKALANPVSIPVERVLAKVEASTGDDFEVIPMDVTPQLDGQDVKFEPVITGMALVNTNPRSYLLKNLGFTALDGFWSNWNDAANFRSYWAGSAPLAANENYETDSYNGIAAGNGENGYSTYCHENTVYSLGDHANATKLLVTAQFKAKNAKEYVSVIKYNGTYFTIGGLKNYLSEQYFKNVKHGENNSNDWRDYMEFVSAETENEWEVELALEDAPEPNDENVDLDDILASINSKTMSQWTDGKCYYYVDVEHFGTGKAAIGVVRNHWYDITINSIKGLGTPVFNPSEDIIPDRMEEENYYVAAEVKILKWKMVSQSVDLK